MQEEPRVKALRRHRRWAGESQGSVGNSPGPLQLQKVARTTLPLPLEEEEEEEEEHQLKEEERRDQAEGQGRDERQSSKRRSGTTGVTGAKPDKEVRRQRYIADHHIRHPKTVQNRQ